MPEFTFPLSIIVLAYIATAILLVIMILLFRMNGRITALSAKLGRNSRAAKLTEPNVAKADSGSTFEKFLKEDAERRSLTKKEQFKAYRKWRSDKGLNWSAKD